MGLTVFPLLQGNTRLIRYQDMLYKVKVTYDEESFQRPRNFLTESVAHNEIEQTFRAILYMDERKQTLKPIHSDSFIIKAVKRPWTFPQKYGNYAFEQNGKVLKVNGFMYELLVSYRDKSLYERDVEHVGTGKRKSNTNNDEVNAKRHKSDDNRVPMKESVILTVPAETATGTTVPQGRFGRTADGKLFRVANTSSGMPVSDRLDKPGPTSEGEDRNNRDQENENTGYDDKGVNSSKSQGTEDEESEQEKTGRRHSERSRTSSTGGGQKQTKSSERKHKAEERIQHVRMEQTMSSRHRKDESPATQGHSRSRRFKVEDVYDLLDEMTREKRKARSRVDTDTDSESEDDYSTKHRVRRKKHKKHRNKRKHHVSRKSRKVNNHRERSRQKARPVKQSRHKDDSETDEELNSSEDEYVRKQNHKKQGQLTRQRDQRSDLESDQQHQVLTRRSHKTTEVQAMSRRRSGRLSNQNSKKENNASESDFYNSMDRSVRKSQRTIKPVERIDITDALRKSKRHVKPVHRYGLDSESETNEKRNVDRTRKLQSSQDETKSGSESECEVEDEVLARIHRKHGVRSQKHNRSYEQESSNSDTSHLIPTQEHSASIKTRTVLDRNDQEKQQKQASSQEPTSTPRSGEQRRSLKEKEVDSNRNVKVRQSPRRSTRLSLVKKPPSRSQESSSNRSKFRATQVQRSQKIRLYTTRASPQVISQNNKSVTSPKVSAVRPVKKMTTDHSQLGNQSTDPVQPARLTRHALERQHAELSRIQQLADERATEVYRNFMRERRDRHTVEMEERAETDKLQQLYQPTQPDPSSPPASQATTSQPSTSGHSPAPPNLPRRSPRLQSPHGSQGNQGSSTRPRTRASIGAQAVSLTQPATRSNQAVQRSKRKSSGLWGAFMDTLVTPTKNLVFGK